MGIDVIRADLLSSTGARGSMMSDKVGIERLLEAACGRPMKAGEVEQQRRSFAYGNAHIENSRVTRAMVDDAADRVKHGE